MSDSNSLIVAEETDIYGKSAQPRTDDNVDYADYDQYSLPENLKPSPPPSALQNNGDDEEEGNEEDEEYQHEPHDEEGTMPLDIPLPFDEPITTYSAPNEDSYSVQKSDTLSRSVQIQEEKNDRHVYTNPTFDPASAQQDATPYETNSNITASRDGSTSDNASETPSKSAKIPDQPTQTNSNDNNNSSSNSKSETIKTTKSQTSNTTITKRKVNGKQSEKKPEGTKRRGVSRKWKAPNLKKASCYSRYPRLTALATVIAYLLFVTLTAIILGLFYYLWWDPYAMLSQLRPANVINTTMTASSSVR